MKLPESAITGFNLFSDYSSYFDCQRVYYAHFKKMPSLKILDQVDMKRLKAWLETAPELKILEKHGKQRYDPKERKLKDLDCHYLLENNMLLNLYEDKVGLLHSSSQDQMAREVLNLLIPFTKRENQKPEIVLVIEGRGGLETTALKIKRPSLDLSVHYNDDLQLLHSSVISALNKKDKSGLYLFHGQPGTGKSTYIRHLIRLINKKVVFMPPGIAANLYSIALTKFLLANTNSVLVIEDAEELLNSREHDKNSALSMLLNLTDGLLGDALGIQIIVTFNTNPGKLDKALLRKGRLIALYEFRLLTIQKSRFLLEKLGISDDAVHEPMTLADIYHAKDNGFQFVHHQRAQIGFLSNAS